MTITINFAGFTGFLGRGAAPRELQCLMAVAAGMTSKEAARDLCIAPDSIDKRLLALTTKLGVTRRAELIAEAFKRGLIFFAVSIPPAPQQQHDQESTQGIFLA